MRTAGPRFRLRPRPIPPAARRLTAGTGAPCLEEYLAWSPDSKQLAFTSDCNDHADSAMDQADVYLAAPGAPSPSPRRLTHLHGGVTSLAFSPDGLHIACLYIEGATRPAGALAPMKPPAGVIGVEGLEIQRVATIETASGEFRQVTPATLHVYEYDWAPDSGQLAYVAAAPPGENNWWVAQLYTQRLAGGQPRVDARPGTRPGPAARPADCGSPLVAGWATDRLHRWPDERPGGHGWRYLSDTRERGSGQGHDPDRLGSRGALPGFTGSSPRSYWFPAIKSARPGGDSGDDC